MKDAVKIFGIVLAAAVIGFIASCSGAGAGGGNTNNGGKTGTGNTGEQSNSTAAEPLVFESVVNGEVLQIIISREPINRSLARSTITPKNGDYYEIILGNKVISKGIISSVGAADKDGWSEIVFTPSSDSPCGNKESFTGTVNPGDVVDSSGLRNGGKLTIPQIPYEGGVLTGIEAYQIDDTESGVIIGAATLNIKGQQVWTYSTSDENIEYVHFTGNRGITGVQYDMNGEYVEIGGSGSITNGLLNFTIGTPSELTEINLIGLFYELLSDYIYSNFKISDNDASFAFLSLLTTGGLDDGYDNFGRGHLTFSGNEDVYREYVDESICYIYVDRDVVITGDGKEWSYYGNDYTTDLNLNLKAGWNTLHHKNFSVVYNSSAVDPSSYSVISISVNNPSYLKWVIFNYNNGVGPSSSVRR